jgi:hypothetical protein
MPAASVPGAVLPGSIAFGLDVRAVVVGHGARARALRDCFTQRIVELVVPSPVASPPSGWLVEHT